MLCPSYSSRFDHSNNIGWEYRSLSSSLCIFLQFPVTLSTLRPKYSSQPLPLQSPFKFVGKFTLSANSRNLTTQLVGGEWRREKRSNTLNAHAIGNKFNLVVVVKFICTISTRMIMPLYCVIVFPLVSLQRYILWQSTVYGDYCP